MRTLHQTLQEADEAVLMCLMDVWGIEETTPNIVDTLTETMLQPENATRVWGTLTDDQRQALQTLLGGDGKMQTSMFKRLFGDIRRMGRGAAEREQPHKHPATKAEALFYHGLIAEAFQMGTSGTQAFIYVPEDLMLVLPTHQTAYDDLDKDDADPLAAVRADQLTETRRADTSIVDDMTTLLAFLQLHAPPVAGDTLTRDSVRDLYPYLLTKGEARIAFMLTIGVSAELIEVIDGHAHPNKANARRWLAANRSEQIEALVRAWLDSELYRELVHVPGLTVERIDSYNPTAARRTLLPTLKEFVPAAEWWDIDEFIFKVKNTVPDFQRPNGDYDSWYIQDMAGEYVHGFESWDTVEGAQLEFLITGPMHWLGLVDVAPEAARLTGYGRGVVGMAAFPRVPDDLEPITLDDDGTLYVSRKVARIDRFQVARFTTWDTAPDPASGTPFAYHLNLSGVHQADEQGINTGHISAFLERVLADQPIPDKIEQLLQTYQSGDTGSVTMQQMTVLRTTSEAVLDNITSIPELRRYLSARLGPMACAVRAEQWQLLQEALLELGIDVEIL